MHWQVTFPHCDFRRFIQALYIFIYYLIALTNGFLLTYVDLGSHSEPFQNCLFALKKGGERGWWNWPLVKPVSPTAYSPHLSSFQMCTGALSLPLCPFAPFYAFFTSLQSNIPSLLAQGLRGFFRPLFCNGMMAGDLICLVRTGRRAYRERSPRAHADSQALVFKRVGRLSPLVFFSSFTSSPWRFCQKYFQGSTD